jgi:(p)ppGpp synthase/HD superfamily hydrolase
MNLFGKQKDIESDRIEKAKEYAIKKHDMPSDSQRYGSLPYSVHLEAVVEIAKKYLYYLKEEYQEDIIMSCWLHDSIEDTDTSPHDLEEMYGNRVADIVFRVSNERGWTRKERNFKTYPKIWVNESAIFVKLCDRISNTKNSKESGHRMFAAYRKEYPTFRYALKVREDLYPDMFAELDLLNEYDY